LSISETDPARYLDKILIEPQEARMIEDFCMDTFFMGASEAGCSGVNAPSNETIEAFYSDIKHRLNLKLRVPVAELFDNENVGFYLHNDSDVTIPSSDKAVKTDLFTWVSKSKPIDFIETKDTQNKECRFSRYDRLCVFQSRILLNLEPETDLTRELDKGVWNNVIPYQPNKGKQYSRSYSVSTGREKVITPCNSGTFKGRNHFNIYDNLSPTEQVFFTLYPLVQTPSGYFDMLSKEEVDEEKLKEIKKIDVLGMVKVVLFYKYSDQKGALQAEDCFIDGLKIPVDRIYQ
jgi:hypothetical protein